MALVISRQIQHLIDVVTLSASLCSVSALEISAEFATARRQSMNLQTGLDDNARDIGRVRDRHGVGGLGAHNIGRIQEKTGAKSRPNGRKIIAKTGAKSRPNGCQMIAKTSAEMGAKSRPKWAETGPTSRSNRASNPGPNPGKNGRKTAAKSR